MPYINRLNFNVRWLLIFLLVSEKTHAQFNYDPPFKYFGFHVGINYSNMNFNQGEPPPPTPIQASWKPGFNVGFSFNVPVIGQLNLQTEFSYVRRNGENKNTGISYRLNYLSIPVLINYQITSSFAVLGGPQLELLIDAHAGITGVQNNITHDVEERSIGITAGIEYDIIKSYFITARFFQGLNHIGIGQRSDVTEFRYQEVTLMAGLRF